MNAIGIYIHIPFCREKCAYCDFYSLPGADEKLMDAYLDALLVQISQTFATPLAHTADTVYIGGGTPSVFGGKRLTRLIKALSARVKLARYCEITLEVNPESVDKKLLRQAADCGINRVSMGVQSADDSLLKKLGRLHTFAQAEVAAELCRKHCTENISIDLMYGLPGQDLGMWAHTLEQALELKPRHISCYGFKLEEGTPMFRAGPDLPDDDIQADMYLYAVSRLAREGFLHYEISNFALPGSHSRHNSKYWDLSDYIGLGCGAHSFFGGKRYSYIKDIDAFISGVRGGSIVDEADDAPFEGRLGEYIMLGLRTARGISEGEIESRFGTDAGPLIRRLEDYISQGLAVRQDDRWRLTARGFLVSNTIIGHVLDAV